MLIFEKSLLIMYNYQKHKVNGDYMGKGKMIGRGNTAEVFLWGENNILKLFVKGFPIEAIKAEYEVSREVSSIGLPVPQAYQMIEVDGRMGIEYEKIDGTDMLKSISKKPWTAFGKGKRLAQLHYKIHQCTPKYAPDQKERMEWAIRRTDLLTDEQKNGVVEILKCMPGGSSLCHGDFHPGNVFLTSDKEVILDWMTATCGNPAADVARTVIMLKDSVIPGKNPAILKTIISITRNKLYKGYIKEYLRLSEITEKDIESWKVIIAGARLMEWVPQEEKEYLLGVVLKVLE